MKHQFFLYKKQAIFLIYVLLGVGEEIPQFVGRISGGLGTGSKPLLCIRIRLVYSSRIKTIDVRGFLVTVVRRGGKGLHFVD